MLLFNGRVTEYAPEIFPASGTNGLAAIRAPSFVKSRASRGTLLRSPAQRGRPPGRAPTLSNLPLSLVLILSSILITQSQQTLKTLQSFCF